ncbi:uncharacterized protein B0I36DRAFT_338866 [Microdochium trichocladiopsis]|uniref:Uncharacterized protein n=1 Tax=Microdochium trichocladiopsis TaxID=1682393 RepID=A0A9P8XSD1_9PEZI|nr:uncharacterized protein B0I36DRAFT_338866 [Microdochium trichocladiopsis]KAH7014528.1 hypothetical protein B0I36DRAFT_338866 [Microdochium trichocladiopsis]
MSKHSPSQMPHLLRLVHVLDARKHLVPRPFSPPKPFPVITITAAALPAHRDLVSPPGNHALHSRPCIARISSFWSPPFLLFRKRVREFDFAHDTVSWIQREKLLISRPDPLPLRMGAPDLLDQVLPRSGVDDAEVAQVWDPAEYRARYVRDDGPRLELFRGGQLVAGEVALGAVELDRDGLAWHRRV